MAEKILILEDEKLILELLTRKLFFEGYKIKTAQNGVEGLEIMAKEKPDLVLTDVVMPQKDGFGVIEEMKKDPVLKSVPIIIISNSGQPVEIERAKKLGVSDWVIKTEFDPNEIIEKVKKALAVSN